MCNFLQFIPFMVFRMGFRPKMCVLALPNYFSTFYRQFFLLIFPEYFRYKISKKHVQPGNPRLRFCIEMK